MKSISKFISLALLIAAATACNTKEIDKPDIPDQPQISGNVRFTASMKQTRVEYSVNGDALHQRWEVDDVIYGFYGDNPVGKVTLKVTEVDKDTEYATLEATVAEEGAAFIAAIKEKGTELKVGLLYTGSDNEVSGNTITVDMSDQSDGRIPACIESSAIERIIEDEESGDTIVYFDFFNDCAILEIKSLTGIENELSEGQTIVLNSVSVSGVDESCTFTYDAPGFIQESESRTGSTIIVRSSDDRPLKVDSDGNIIDANGNRSCIRIAVCPIYRSSTITITATSTASHPYISHYQGSLSPSGCYIICAQDVVAKTEDGFFFTTVKAAFDHAEYLNVNSLLGDKPNIVTLVNENIEEGFGMNNSNFTDGDGLEYMRQVINYKVTLDLNGCKLSLDDRNDAVECFYVTESGDFTIMDSKGPDGMGKFSGTLTSDANYDIIDNYGKVTINGGTFEHTNVCNIVYNDGELNVLAGELSSNYSVVDNYGTLKVSKKGNSKTVKMSTVSEKTYATIWNEVEAEIEIYEGATLEGTNGATIYNYHKGIVKIHGGSIISQNTNAIDNKLYNDEYDEDEDTKHDSLPKVFIYGGTLETTYGFAAIQNQGYLYTATDDELEGDITITAGNCHAIYNNCIIEINNGTISSNGETSGSPSIYRAAICSEDDHPADDYPCKTIINGGEITSETNDAIKILSYYSYDTSEGGKTVTKIIDANFIFSMEGGDIVGHWSGICFCGYDEEDDEISFPDSDTQLTGTSISFTNGSTINGETKEAIFYEDYPNQNEN